MTRTPQLDRTGVIVSDRTAQSQRIGRDMSASSAASRSTSTKLAKADRVKLSASRKATLSRLRGAGAGGVDPVRSGMAQTCRLDGAIIPT